MRNVITLVMNVLESQKTNVRKIQKNQKKVVQRTENMKTVIVNQSQDSLMKSLNQRVNHVIILVKLVRELDHKCVKNVTKILVEKKKC